MNPVVMENSSLPGTADRKYRYMQWGLFLLLILVHIPSPVIFPAEEALDWSWMKALLWAFRDHVQFGKDFIFTYGPAGILMWPQDWCTLTASFLASGLCLFFLAGYFRIRSEKELLWKLVFIILTLPCSLWDMILLFLPYVMLEKTRERPEKKELIFLACCTLAGTFCIFVKFTFFPVVLVSAVCLDLILLLRYRKMVSLPVFLLALPCFWMGLGQRIGNLPGFLYYSMQISSGYNESMVYFQASPVWLPLLLLICGVFAGYVILCLRECGSFHLPEKIIAFFLCMIPVYVSFKYGIVRMDGGHIGGGICSLVGIIAFLACRGPRNVRHDSVIRLFLTGYSALLIFCVVWKLLPDMPKEIFSRYANYVRMEKISYPAKDKKKTCDLFTYDEFDFMHRLGFTYSPRPVLQTYSAYTPALMRLNKEYILSEKAPEYLLFHLHNLDRRLPMAADYSILPLCGKYEVVREWKGKKLLLLLKKKKKPAPLALIPVSSVSFLPGEKVVMPETEGVLYASFRLPCSLLGHLTKLFWRVPPPKIEIELDPRGKISYDLIPSMVSEPFLFSPYMESTEEFRNLCSGKSAETGRKIRSFRIIPDQHILSKQPCPWDQTVGKMMFADVFSVTFFHLSVSAGQ